MSNRQKAIFQKDKSAQKQIRMTNLTTSSGTNIVANDANISIETKIKRLVSVLYPETKEEPTLAMRDVKLVGVTGVPRKILSQEAKILNIILEKRKNKVRKNQMRILKPGMVAVKTV